MSRVHSPRISKTDWALQLALATAKRSTCCRRNVGCVLLDSSWRVLSTGFNGVARGQPHCNELSWTDDTYTDEPHTSVVMLHACPGVNSPSGTNLDGCLAIHAEQNALLQCRDPDRIHTCVVTTSPCLTCTKLLLNTGCQEIYFLEEYPQPAAELLWHPRGWTKLSLSGNRP